MPLNSISLDLTCILLLGAAIAFADAGRSDFRCSEKGQVLYSNLTTCQLEELTQCSFTYYPQFDTYLRSLACPLPLCNPDGNHFNWVCGWVFDGILQVDRGAVQNIGGYLQIT